MLKIVYSTKELDYYGLTRVYEQSIRQDGAVYYPSLSNEEQRIRAEQDFYNYLNIFFSDGKSFCALWCDEGGYISAMRLEPYRDGLLISGLETLPEVRGKGYAGKLLQATMRYLKDIGVEKVYSHVDKRNIPSLSVHKKAGFSIISDFARYLDGSVSHRSYTLCLE